MPSAKISSLPVNSVPKGRDRLAGVNDPAATSPATEGYELDRLWAIPSVTSDFRLTLTADLAVTTANVTGATVLRYEPDGRGNRLRVYDGTRWKHFQLPGFAMPLGTLANNSQYDAFPFTSSATPSATDTGTDTLTFGAAHGWKTGAVAFVSVTGGGLTAGTTYFVNAPTTTTLTLHTTLANALAGTVKVDLTGSITTALTVVSLELSAAWASDTSRTDALTTQDGVSVKSGAPTRLHAGVVRTTSTTTIEDSSAKRFVNNRYNQRLRPFSVASSSVHVYDTTTIRPWNNDTALRVAFVLGQIELVEYAAAGDLNQSAFQVAAIGANIDNTTGFDVTANYAGTAQVTVTAPDQTYPSIGHHFIQAMQQGAGATTNFFSVRIVGAVSG